MVMAYCELGTERRDVHKSRAEACVRHVPRIHARGDVWMYRRFYPSRTKLEHNVTVFEFLDEFPEFGYLPLDNTLYGCIM